MPGPQGSPTGAPPPIRRAGEVGLWLARRLALTAVLVVVPLLLAELTLRHVPVPSAGLQRFLFHLQFNRSRWAFLDLHRERLLIDTDMHSLPNQDHVVFDPEPNRPPFDRVAVPYRVQTNEEAFRDDRLDRPRPAGKRILVYGDSITFGRGVERPDRYTDVLRAALPAGFDVVNFGVLGCTSKCMAHRIERGLALEPDLVVIQASGNDLDQVLYQLARDGRVTPQMLRLLEVTMEYRVLLYLAYLLGGDPYDRQVDAGLTAATQAYDAALERIFAACKRKGVPVVVLDVPFATGVHYARHVAERCRAEPRICLGVATVAMPDAAASPGPRDEQREGPDWLRDTAGVADLDIEALAAAIPFHRAFFDIVHPNAQGHRAIAEQLGAFLRAHWPALKVADS